MIVEKAAHVPQLEQLDRVSQVVRDFLTDLMRTVDTGCVGMLSLRLNVNSWLVRIPRASIRNGDPVDSQDLADTQLWCFR